MKVIVLGSGVIGTSVAYYLARAGHEVEVLDRQPGPGLETSFANAGEVSPGYSSPWAAPGLLIKAAKWIAMRHRPLVVWPLPSAALMRWALQLLSNANAASYEINKGRMLRLAEYSRDCLRDLRAETGIRYDERTQGTLQLFRSQRQIDAAQADVDVLKRYGVPWQLLDREACIRQEPALGRVAEKFVGGLLLPDDETGDCHKFTQALAALASELGVQFRHNVDIRGLLFHDNQIDGVRTDQGTRRADAYVAALGSYTPLMLRPLGIALPVYPVKGYSLTVPITNADAAPQSTVMDETYKVAVTRLGERIRVGGTAELAGFDLRLRAPRRGTLEHVVRDLFPAGGDVASATFWTGLRPMTPDGTPVVGPTSFRRLWLATGHGTLGWTMAAGTGQALADWISGRPTAIDTADLSIDRYAHGQSKVGRSLERLA